MHLSHYYNVGALDGPALHIMWCTAYHVHSNRMDPKNLTTFTRFSGKGCHMLHTLRLYNYENLKCEFSCVN